MFICFKTYWRVDRGWGYEGLRGRESVAEGVEETGNGG